MPKQTPLPREVPSVALPRGTWKNYILVTENVISIPPSAEATARAAERIPAKREPTDDVRRLLDAALEVIRQHGTALRPRVADIVAVAGLSNDAFYRLFPSKDALVTALLEDGTSRLASYVGHQMGKETTPEGKVRRWVKGVLSQTRQEIAATTLAVLWNGGSTGLRHNASAPLATLLFEPFAALGSTNPVLDASLVAHATLGMVSEHLWLGTSPSRAEVDRVTEFCVKVAVPQSAAAGRGDPPTRSQQGALARNGTDRSRR